MTAETYTAAEAAAWRDTVEDLVRESAGDNADQLLDSMSFLERLDPTIGLDPESDEFADLVTEAVAEHLGLDAVEAEADRTDGRVMEARGTGADGGRVYRVRIIAYGTSKNGRNYPPQVMREAVALYEGARAFDHHRTAQELETSTINGLVGHYRNVEAAADGLYGDLHLLPSATHAAEALDAAIAAQAAGLEPVVGISHDVRASFRVAVIGGRRVQEAVQIVSVDSADIVAKPSAGGLPVRAVAGGDPITEEEPDVTTTANVLAALGQATDADLAAVGLVRAATATESITPTQRALEGEVQSAREAAQPKTGFMAGLMIKTKVKDAGLPESVVESITLQLPDFVRESDVDAAVASLKGALAVFERGNLTPSATVQVTKESFEKKVAALDGLFEGNGRGYTSFRAAYVDLTGNAPRAFDGDFARRVMRECVGAYDSADRASERTTESLTASSFAQLLGDSVARRMVAEYSRPNLQTWKLIVSGTPAVPDFRTQRVGRMGGYGTLPAVNEGAPYQPLTSPDDEEATYAVTKRGGTEDLTLEMIANDDIRAISKIPFKLGLAAAQTLYRFVWDMLPTNAATTYDSVALFHASHSNTASGALNQTNLTAGRVAMRQQAAYGDTSDILSLTPQYLVVPSALEEIAFQLCTSAVAIPSTAAGPSDTPNLHQGLKPIVIDYYSDTNDWYLTADPSMCPTIEVGFYQGRQEPELFTQSDNNVGSMFNNDTLTYKIRHIYSGTVIDHRGFYRGSN